MKKIIKLILSILVLVIVAGCDQDKKDDEQVIVPVMVYETQPEMIWSYLKLTGSLEAGIDIELHAMSTERIKKIHVQKGDQVTAGNLLLEQESGLAEQSVRVALAGLNTARASNELVQKEYNRMQKLYLEKAVSEQQLDQVTMQKQTAEAGLDLAEAQLEQARQHLNYTKIFAPFDGEIAMINSRQGEMISAGMPVFRLVSNSDMRSRLQASEADMKYIDQGQRVLAKFPSLGDEEYSGKVINIDSAINPRTRALEVEVFISNKTEELRSGMFGEFHFVIEQREEVVVLSDAAVMTRTKLRIDRSGRQIADKEYYVFVLNGEIAEMRQVETGVHSQGRLEITKGLEIGDKIIVVGQNIVKDGDMVRVLN
jgi:membrane fusion protein, multidrug efflux system